MTRVAVFGMGYVGCVTAACLSRDGHPVVGVDVDPAKVAAIGEGRSPVTEPLMDELVRSQTAAEMLRVTQDVSLAVRQSEIAMLTVGTPSTPDGAVSTAAVKRVVREIGEALRADPRDYTVVVRSTLLPGILESQLAPLLSDAAGRELGAGLQLCSNPEFLREGSAIRDYDMPPFVVVGTLDGWKAENVLALYDRIDAPKIVTDSRSASLLKYACNAYHALKIAFANEVGTLAKALGADGCEVMRLVCRDTKLNISPAYLRPGFAFGGSCLPKDVRALTRYAEREAIRLPLLSAVLPSNQEHLQRAIRLIEGSGCRRLGLVGLSFKAGTDDLRESPFVALAETLIGRGYDLRIFDPVINVSRLCGRNRAYMDEHLPHLAALLVEEPHKLQEHASLLLIATDVADEADLVADFEGTIVDLRRALIANDPTPRPAARPQHGG